MRYPGDILASWLCTRSKAYRAFRDIYQVSSLVGRWRNYVKREDHFSRYAEMTSHGPSHVEGVATMVTDLATQTDFLTDAEKFVLLAGAYLHDVGTYTTYDDYYEDPMKIRKMHGVLSMQRIRRESHLLLPTLGGDEVRLIALLCSYHQGKAALSEAELNAKDPDSRMQQPFFENLRGDLVEVPGSPSEQSSLERMLDQATGRGQECFCLQHLDSGDMDKARNAAVCPFLMATLLKLLDGCDFQIGRTGCVETLLRHGDRNASHLIRSEYVLDDSKSGSPSWRRANEEAQFFRGSIFHFMRNLLIEKTVILFDKEHGCLEVVIKPADPDDVLQQCYAFASVQSQGGGMDRAQARMLKMIDLLKDYQLNPKQTIIAALRMEPDNKFLREWDVKTHKDRGADRQTVHVAVARAYIERELRDVADAIVSPDAGRDYHYCNVCPNRKREGKDKEPVYCPLRNRAIPSFGTPGNWNITTYDSGSHLKRMLSLPYLSPFGVKLPAGPVDARPEAEAKLVNRLKQERQLLVYGPHGAGKTVLAYAVARELTSEESHRVFWHTVIRGVNPVESLVCGLADFLASNGEFSLGNLVRGQRVTPRHSEYALKLLEAGMLAPQGGSFLMCVDQFNQLDSGVRAFFQDVIERFGCISCLQATQCDLPPGQRWCCKRTAGYALIMSSKVPSWHRKHREDGIPIATMPAPAWTGEDAKQALQRILPSDVDADAIQGIWTDYGGQPVALGLLHELAASALPASAIPQVFSEELAGFFAKNFAPRNMANPREVEILRLVSMMDGHLTATDVRFAFGLVESTGEGPLESVIDRGLVHKSNGRLAATPAWTSGHRRSRWQDRLPVRPWQLLMQYVASCDGVADVLSDCWADISPYVPELAALADVPYGASHMFDLLQHSFQTLRNLAVATADLGKQIPEMAQTVRHHLQKCVTGGSRPWAGMARGQLLRIAALYHDIGKKATCQVTGKDATFAEHETVGADQWTEIARRESMSEAQADFVGGLIRDHVRPLSLFGLDDLSEKAVARFVRTAGERIYELLLLFWADRLASGQAGEGDGEVVAFVRRILSQADEMSRQTREVKATHLTGKDLIDAGLEPGPVLGRALAEANSEWRKKSDMTREQAIQVARNAYEQGGA